MSQTPGWQEVLRPLLESKVKHSWVDPRKARSIKKFFYEYSVAWGFATAAQEILDWIDGQIALAKKLQEKQRKGEVKSYAIGE